MDYRLRGLDPAPFRSLFTLSNDELAARGMRAYVADATPGFPCRVDLADAEPGERVLLINYAHQPAPTAYRASHAIFVREGARVAYDRTNEVPRALAIRTLSIRSFDAEHDMLDADLVEGGVMETLVRRLFANARAAYLHVHYAKRGCYAARVDRA